MAQFETQKFRGSFCALATPFQRGELDRDAFSGLVDWHLAAGTNGLVPCGTTGESPNLTREEQDFVIEECVARSGGKVPVLAGTGTNSTRESIERTERAEQLGVTAVMLVAPYYNKPTQEGLYQHFKAIAAATSLPVIIYNVPGRTVTDVSVETLGRLAEILNIIGVKDATANIERVGQQRDACGPDFVQLSGEDATALEFNAAGGDGCISVTANAAPALCAEMQAASLSGNSTKAQEIQHRLMPLHEALFLETSPGPLKYALSLLGKCEDELRLPLVPPTENTRTKVRAALIHAGLLEE